MAKYRAYSSPWLGEDKNTPGITLINSTFLANSTKIITIRISERIVHVRNCNC